MENMWEPTLTKGYTEELEDYINRGYSVLIVGAVNTGKTTLLNWLKTKVEIDERPNWRTYDEIRDGKKVDTMVNARKSGKSIMGVIHGNSPEDGIKRLYAHTRIEEPQNRHTEAEIVNLFDVVLHVERLADGTRILRETTETEEFKYTGR